ncbi:hypothetical protein Xenpb_00510 [Xenorhabdus sp. PB62.4]|nr:hypothetical protein [Xenorhabdus sp. PB62.4]
MLFPSIIVQGNNKADNCDQFSYIALEYLVENSKIIWQLYKKPFSIDLVSINSSPTTFGHIFVAFIFSYNYPINQLLDEKEDSEVWICDPWANIACRSYEYPFQWKKKMSKWSLANKQLSVLKRVITYVISIFLIQKPCQSRVFILKNNLYISNYRRSPKIRSNIRNKLMKSRYRVSAPVIEYLRIFSLSLTSICSPISFSFWVSYAVRPAKITTPI